MGCSRKSLEHGLRRHLAGPIGIGLWHVGGRTIEERGCGRLVATFLVYWEVEWILGVAMRDEEPCLRKPEWKMDC